MGSAIPIRHNGDNKKPNFPGLWREGGKIERLSLSTKKSRDAGHHPASPREQNSQIVMIETGQEINGSRVTLSPGTNERTLPDSSGERAFAPLRGNRGMEKWKRETYGGIVRFQ